MDVSLYDGTFLLFSYEGVRGVERLWVCFLNWLAFCCIVGGILGLIYQGGCIEGRVDKEAECVVGAHGVLF
ncbi:hypothetical protein [Bartonella harrusi]|uniref:Transmembrane protein n=1 Tax=Bartonella harrusi TaxID=2961895 RepID=A0ABY5ERZ9_9HYPH|nr:hypothetical protein [Bartonella harrusi]UTO28172.1 hypothetical protein NMK50_08360 [Bartonella harrusi]